MIKLFNVFVAEDVDQALLETLHSGYITQGQKVEEFEQAFGEYVGNPLAVSVNSCTSALTLALRLSNVGYGDEVITTPMTCSATNLPILSLGAMPVFADIDPKTGLIDPESVKRLITTKTKAIVATDWGGAPVDVQALRNMTGFIKIIVDSAHALGATHNATPDFQCFSLQAIKHLTTGDGGFLMCSNEEDYIRAKKLRWFGISRNPDSKDTRIDEDITEWGYKFHMNDLVATIGLEQLKHISFVAGAYKANALYYNRVLNSDVFGKPPIKDNAYWIYTITLPNKVARDKFKDYMLANKIQVSEVHRRNDEYSVFKPFKKSRLPGVDAFSRTMVAIPCHWALTAKEVVYIANTMDKFVNEFRQYL